MPSNWDLDRVERLAKIIGATSIPALGLVVTTLLHQDQQSSREQELKIERERQSQQTAVESENRKQQAEIAERNRRAQLFAQMMSNRERADSEIRATMFRSLLDNYFELEKGKPARSLAGIQREILLVNLLIKNFEEYFNTRSCSKICIGA